ncbi:MAG TPA: hypothetical protein DEA08_28660 [Planctomycetes bacterium]|nr:hypothetical protein [Planctomycetota bacterium]
MNDDANDDEWPLDPEDELDAEDEALGQLTRSLGAGAVAGLGVIFGLGFVAAPMHTAGASRSIQQRDSVRKRCMELGVTPAELELMIQRGEVPPLEDPLGDPQ